MSLTPRQEREREYYNEFSARRDDLTTTFDPVEGDEERPWNSYWFVYQAVRELRAEGKERLLDFGCGTGLGAVRYAKIGYEVHGFDISEVNIERAMQRAQMCGLADRTAFEVQTAEDLNYPNEFFDVVVGMDILHHVEVGPALQEAHRVLKPGGTAVFREWIEVPILDRIRNLSLVRRVWPNEKSLDSHITEDERKLNREDVAVIRSVFPNCRGQRFRIFSRLGKVLPIRNRGRASRLEQFDQMLIKYLPFLRRMGGEVVFLLKKEGPQSAG